MDWARYAAVVSLLVVATVAGGAGVRMVVILGDIRAATVLGVVVLVLAVAVATGARGRRWRRNPYW